MKSFKSYVENRDLNEMAEMALPSAYDVEATKEEELASNVGNTLNSIDKICKILDNFFDPQINPSINYLSYVVENKSSSALNDIVKEIKNSIQIINISLKNHIRGNLIDNLASNHNKYNNYADTLKYYTNLYQEEVKNYYDNGELRPNSTQQQIINDKFLIPSHEIHNIGKQIYQYLINKPSIEKEIKSRYNFKIINKN